jgi:hypothetical protein
MTTSRSPERLGPFLLAITTALLAIVLAVWFVATAHAEPSHSRSFYDKSGSFAGSSVECGNSTRLYDKAGRFDGSVIRNSEGTASFYDASGRFAGSSTNTFATSVKSSCRERRPNPYERRVLTLFADCGNAGCAQLKFY